MKPVTTKWQTDGDLAVLYKVGNILLFFSKDQDPHFKSGQEISQEEANQSGYYKAIPYTSENLPSDAFIDLSFSWNTGGKF
jgi:hypothetical protein